LRKPISRGHQHRKTDGGAGLGRFAKKIEPKVQFAGCAFNPARQHRLIELSGDAAAF
jgi:hypothetical protein